MLAVISPVYNLPSAVRKVFAGMSRSTKFGLPRILQEGCFFLVRWEFDHRRFLLKNDGTKDTAPHEVRNFPCIFQQSLKLAFYNHYYSFGSWLDQNPEISPLFLIVSATSVVAHSHLTLPKGISFGIDYFATNNNFWDSTGSTCTFRDFMKVEFHTAFASNAAIGQRSWTTALPDGVLFSTASSMPLVTLYACFVRASTNINAVTSTAIFCASFRQWHNVCQWGGAALIFTWNCTFQNAILTQQSPYY